MGAPFSAPVAQPGSEHTPPKCGAKGSNPFRGTKNPKYDWKIHDKSDDTDREDVEKGSRYILDVYDNLFSHVSMPFDHRYDILRSQAQARWGGKPSHHRWRLDVSDTLWHHADDDILKLRRKETERQIR